MRFVLATLCAMAAAASAHADVGIGVSAKSDSATIYVPVTVRRFMFEPYVRATDRESESVSAVGETFTLYTANTSGVQANAVGVGIFRLVPLADRFTLYYGGRLTHIDEELKSFSATGVSLPLTLEPSESTDLEGHSVTPTLGFHYTVVDRFSVGLEVGVERADADATTFTDGQFGTTQTTRSEITTNDTRAELVLRFFF